MIINGKDPESGEEYEAEVGDVDAEFVVSMSDFDMADDDIKRFIDNLNISADIKSLLYSFTKATIRAGKYIIKIGRKIIDYVISLCKAYPNVTVGAIFGAVVGYLISAIPIIGVVLGPLFTPIAIAIGIVIGIKEDLKDKDLERKIAEIKAKFSPLGAAVAP